MHVSTFLTGVNEPRKFPANLKYLVHPQNFSTSNNLQYTVLIIGFLSVMFVCVCVCEREREHISYIGFLVFMHMRASGT